MSNFKNKLSSFVKGEGVFSGALSALVVGLAIVANIIIFVLGSYFSLYIHLDEVEDLTLSGYTDSLFADPIKKGERVKIIFCQSEEEVKANDKGSRVLETVKNFKERYGDFIELEFVNIVTKMNNKNEYVDLTVYQTVSEGGKKSPILESTVIFESDYGHRVLTDSASKTGYANFYTVDTVGNVIAYNGEETVAAMITSSLSTEKKTAYFTTYHGEISDSAFQNMLAFAGYGIGVIDLLKNEIPEDAELVVISNPKKDFKQADVNSKVKVRTEIERLRTFVEDGGGKIYVSLDPYTPKLPVFESFLADYGIKLSETENKKAPAGYLRNIIRDSDSSVTTDFLTIAVECADNEIGNKVSEKMDKYTDSSVIVKECAALQLSGKAQPLLVASPTAALYAGSDVVDSEGGYCVAAVTECRGKNPGTIFLTPTVYLTASDALVTEGYANRPFVYSMIENVFDGKNLPYGCKTVYYTTTTLENLSMKDARLYTALIMAIPAVIAVVGAVIVIRRKNR